MKNLNLELTENEIRLVLNCILSKKVDLEYKMQDKPKDLKLIKRELSEIELKLLSVDTRTRFQIIEKNECGDQIHLNELKSSDRVTLSINAMYEGLKNIGKVVVLQKWMPGDKEATIIFRSWVK